MSKPSFLLNYNGDDDLKEWFEVNKSHKTEAVKMAIRLAIANYGMEDLLSAVPKSVQYDDKKLIQTQHERKVNDTKQENKKETKSSDDPGLGMLSGL